MITANNIIYEEAPPKGSARTQLHSVRNSISIDNSLNLTGVGGADFNLQRKVNANLKWFTSQISELPGPKKNLVKNIGQEYKVEQKEEIKLQEEKNRLKNR